MCLFEHQVAASYHGCQRPEASSSVATQGEGGKQAAQENCVAVIIAATYSSIKNLFFLRTKKVDDGAAG